MSRVLSSFGVVVSCEHGGNEVPSELQQLFVAKADLLRSHRGWDPGSLELGECLARTLGAPLVASRLSRLVVDLNRSRHHRACFSEITRGLSRETKLELLERYYHPHRRRVQEAIARQMRHGAVVVHLAVHTFTPNLDGTERRVDLGLLYDPRRRRERTFCRLLAAELRRRLPHLRTRFNNPYLGRADGLTTALRRHHDDDRYLGIELEVSQGLVSDRDGCWQQVRDELPVAIAATLGLWAGGDPAAGGSIKRRRPAARRGGSRTTSEAR